MTVRGELSLQPPEPAAFLPACQQLAHLCQQLSAPYARQFHPRTVAAQARAVGAAEARIVEGIHVVGQLELGQSDGRLQQVLVVHWEKRQGRIIDESPMHANLEQRGSQRAARRAAIRLREGSPANGQPPQSHYASPHPAPRTLLRQVWRAEDAQRRCGRLHGYVDALHLGARVLQQATDRLFMQGC